MIKAIETVYNGYRFRSRLEARWAVFFDALEVPYEYEKEGFNLGKDGYYLPDFWLPTFNIFVEIKPWGIPKTEWYKALALQRMNYLAGEDVISVGLTGEAYTQRRYIGVVIIEGEPWIKTEDGWLAIDCSYVIREFWPVEEKEDSNLLDISSEYPWFAFENQVFVECRSCGKLTFEGRGIHILSYDDEGGGFARCDCDTERAGLSCTKLLMKAYIAARQSRFEHGAHGR